MDRIQITEKLKETATQMEEAILALRGNHLHDKSYTKLASDHRNYYGYLGELLFVRYLILKHKRGEYLPRFDGKTDNGDVTLFTRDLVIPADIKTASKESHQYLMLPAVQFKKKTTGTYIGMRLTEEYGQVMGFARAEDLKPIELSLPVPSVGIRFTELRPIEELIERLEDGSMTVDLSRIRGAHDNVSIH